METTADKAMRVTYGMFAEVKRDQDSDYALDDGSLKWQFEAIRRAGGHPAIFVGPLRYRELRELAITETTCGLSTDAHGNLSRVFGIPVILKWGMGALWALLDESTERSAWVMDKLSKEERRK